MSALGANKPSNVLTAAFKSSERRCERLKLADSVEKVGRGSHGRKVRA